MVNDRTGGFSGKEGEREGRKKRGRVGEMKRRKGERMNGKGRWEKK